MKSAKPTNPAKPAKPVAVYFEQSEAILIFIYIEAKGSEFYIYLCRSEAKPTDL
jgi:hypothetical protein